MTHYTIKFYYDANKNKNLFTRKKLKYLQRILEILQIVHPRNILEASLDTNINHMAAPTFH